MPLAAVANWLFNWALGVFVPPALRNIMYKLFLIFGVLCFAAALQAWLTYPETCGKTLEEIELLFAADAPPAWKTKPGGSRIEAEIERVRARKTGEGGDEMGGEVGEGEIERKGLGLGLGDEEKGVGALVATHLK